MRSDSSTLKRFFLKPDQQLIFLSKSSPYNLYASEIKTAEDARWIGNNFILVNPDTIDPLVKFRAMPADEMTLDEVVQFIVMTMSYRKPSADLTIGEKLMKIVKHVTLMKHEKCRFTMLEIINKGFPQQIFPWSTVLQMMDAQPKKRTFSFCKKPKKKTYVSPRDVALAIDRMCIKRKRSILI